MKLWERLPPELRAGTHIDHAHKIEIWGPRPQGYGNQIHGLIDIRQRVYQGGGELRNFVLWKRRLVTMDLDVWFQVLESEDVEWIEMIDHDLNHCYRIRKDVADREGYIYNEGIGDRYGVPLHLWDKSAGPVEPHRPQPPAAPNEPTVRQLGLL